MLRFHHVLRASRVLPLAALRCVAPGLHPVAAIRRLSTDSKPSPSDAAKDDAGKVAASESAPAEATVEEVKAVPTEASVGESTTLEFQAETKKLLDIVAKSLYTDKEVFVRELISNASDALEKRRHASLVGSNEGIGEGTDMSISITTDEEANTLTIQDTGIGMSRIELMENLGTIARSGSKNFMQQLDDGAAASTNVIGQFGVGFYAVFMVADQVTVYSRKHGEDAAHCWESTGDGSYALSEASNVAMGTKIVIQLKPDQTNFSRSYHIEQNIRKYSNFVGFPIELDGNRVNTVEPVWTKSKNEVSVEQHTEFYRFVSQSFDDPRYTLHFTADAPVSIRAIFYVPQTHMEKWGMSRQDNGVHLYSRKVLIQSKCDKLLPEWMRFLKGVVDSEDLPLNISRESMQDSALMAKLSSVLSKKMVKFLQENAKRDEKKYLEFYKEFGQFIKEGVYSDFTLKNEAAKLLRFESSGTTPQELISLDDYIGRMVPEQQDKIYWLSAPSRQSAVDSAYMEAFKAKGIEVLLLYSTVDEFVMNNLMSYEGKSLVSAETADLDVDKSDDADALKEDDLEGLRAWMADTITGVHTVNVSSRLVDSPAIVVGHESAGMRRMMSMVESGNAPVLPPQKLEINAGHQIIRSLAQARSAQPELAAMVAQQVFSNALVTAGLLDDPRSMLNNVNSIMAESLARALTPSTDAESLNKAVPPTTDA